MAATTHPPEETGPGPAPAGPGLLLRFDRLERVVHWVNAFMFGILILTGAALYLEPIGGLVGRRALVEEIHVYTGVALPVPLLLALSGSWGRALRQDLGRFNRWSRTDRLWLRSLFQPGPVRRKEMASLQVGKFNAGQKLNAAFIAGGGLVMLGTGAIMRWYHPWPLSWRTGATFVHDWLALAIGLVVIGHIGMALRDPDALRSMVVGSISRSWAKRHAPAWLSGRDQPDAGPRRRSRPVPPPSARYD
jgi:formate dehydrogenase subunit gamma